MLVQGCVVVSGTKRQHSGNLDGGASYQKQARIESNAEDMDLDESGMLHLLIAVAVSVSCTSSV